MSKIVKHKARVMQNKGISRKQVAEALKMAIREVVKNSTEAQGICNQIAVAGGGFRQEFEVESYLGNTAMVHIKVPTKRLLKAMSGALYVPVGEWGGVRLDNGEVTFSVDDWGRTKESEHFTNVLRKHLTIADVAITMKLKPDEVEKMVKDLKIDVSSLEKIDAGKLKVAATLASEFEITFAKAWGLVNQLKMKNEAEVRHLRQSLTTQTFDLSWIEQPFLEKLIGKVGGKILPSNKMSLSSQPVVRNIIPESEIKCQFVVSFGSKGTMAFRQKQSKEAKKRVWEIVGRQQLMEEMKPFLAEMRQMVSAWQSVDATIDTLTKQKQITGLAAVKVEITRANGSVQVQMSGLKPNEYSQKMEFRRGLAERAKTDELSKDKLSLEEPLIPIGQYSIGATKQVAFDQIADMARLWMEV